jgi:hypothetical protein
VYQSQFEKIFKEHTGNLIHKWHHYFEIYEKHFQRFKGKKIVLLEIGIHKGGSLEMWRKYFGEECEIIGVDINPLCHRFENEKTRVFIGSQDDREFLRELKAEIPKVDILIDDGGHMMDQLRITFEELYDWVVEDGVYLVEDLHTCYWPAYEGGYKRKNSFIEYCKSLVDQLNAWHSQTRELTVSNFSRNTHSIHFYDSIVVFEKRKINKPFNLFAGKDQNQDIDGDPPRIDNLWRKLKHILYRVTRIDL